MDNQKKRLLIIKAVILIVFAPILVIAAFRYSPDILKLISDPTVLKRLLASCGSFSIPVYMGIALVQVIIAAIPGELVEIAGGYIYGVMPGTFYSIIGITAGAVLVFYVTRLLGYPFINLFVPKKTLDKFAFIINNPKAEIAMLVLFLLPGIPKDILTYIAGLTPIRPSMFFLLSTLGRIPSLVVTCYIGASLQQGNYVAVIIITVVTCLLVAAGIFMKDRVVGLLDKLLYKKSLKPDSASEPTE